MTRPSKAHAATAADTTAPAALQQLATSYHIAQAIYVAVRLGLPELLADGPRGVEELAQATGAHAPSLFRLLRALAASEVFDEVAPGQFALAPMGACLRADAPISLRDAVLMWGSEHFWQTAADLLHSVQTGDTANHHLFGTANSFEYYRTNPEIGAMMSAGWAALAHTLTQEVPATYDFSTSGTIVDVGGNRGHILAAILRAYPTPHGVLFDLPHVAQAPAPIFEQAGVSGRVTVVGGDMFAEVPSSGDTYLLSRVIHDWDDARATAILRSCRRAMRPQTTLLLIERVMPVPLDHSLAARLAVTTDLVMLLRTGGQERTAAEYEALLASADFTLEQIIPMPSGFCIIKCAAGSSIPSR